MAIGANEDRDFKKWCGNVSWESVKALSLSGDESYVKDARKLIDKIESQFISDSKAWFPSVYGAYPCVPEALAGFPESMRRKAPQESDNAPVKIWVSLSAVASTTPKTLVTRGAALLALAMALINSGRTVDLRAYIAWEGNGEESEFGVTIKIETTPLCLAEACFILRNPGFLRRSAFSSLNIMGATSSNSAANGHGITQEQYCTRLAAQEGLAMATPRIEGDAESKINSDVVAWLNSRMGGIKALLGDLENAT